MTSPIPDHIYNLSDAELDNVRKKLIELKPNIRKFWSTGGELTNLFENHEIVAAMGWPLTTNQLRKAEFPIGETIPKENTTGWIDHLMITTASENKDLATEFLEYMIEAKTQKAGDRRDRLRPCQSARSGIHDRRAEKIAASGRCGRIHDAHLFLAERAAARQVQRNLERNKGGAVTTAASHPARRSVALPTIAAILSIRQVIKRFGKRPVLRGITLDVAGGEFLTILGESGSGKTTLLRLIAGFERSG